MTRDQLKAALLELPEGDREELALEVLSDFSDVSVSPEWMTEVRRRDQEIRDGLPVLKDADRVFSDAFKRLDAQS